MTAFLLAVLLAAPPLEAEEALRRNQAWTATGAAVTAEYQNFADEVRFSERTRVWLEMPRRGRVSTENPDFRYTYLSTADRIVEIDFLNRAYDDRPGAGGYVEVKSVLGANPGSLIPHSALAQPARRLIPPGGTPTVTGRVAVLGRSGTELLVRRPADQGGGPGAAQAMRPPMESGEPEGFWFVIADDGQLLRFRYRVATMEGVIDRRFDFYSVTRSRMLPDRDFEVEIPAGFEAATLPRERYPVAAEGTVSLGSWTQANAGTSRTIDVAGSPRLFIFVSADDPASRSLMRSLTGYRTAMRSVNGQVVLLSVERDRAAARADAEGLGLDDLWFDPTGRRLDALGVPGTPYLMLVRADGKLAQAWYGDDPAGLRAFERSFRELLKPPKTDGG